MSKSLILSLLAQGNTGSEILSILDAIASDNVSGFDYIESPLIESALGIPTLGEVALWYTYCVPSGWHWGALMLYYEYHLAVMREWHRLTVFCGAGLWASGGVL